MRRCGTKGNGVAGGTVTPRRDDSRDDGICESTDGSCESIDASGDTRVKPWHGVTLTHGCEGGVVDDGDDADEVGGEADGALWTTWLVFGRTDALKVGAVEGGGYGATRPRTRRPARSCSFACRFSSRMRSLSALFMGAKR